ncbi:MAG: glycosyltransferase [Candidatus Edwardsbacteria bacterium]|nr:glycosyltransferase [Candidatus Edwardsbacteria bacterium]
MIQRKKTRVLFFDHVPFLGGAEQSLLDILRGLDRERFEPLLLVTSPGPLAERALAIGVAVRYITVPEAVLRRKRYAIRLLSPRSFRDALRLLPVVVRLAALCRRERIGVVHTNTLKAHLIGGLAGRLCGCRVVWHFRDILVRPGLRRLIVWLSRRLSDRVIAISGAVKDQFGAGYPASRIEVIYNAIDGDEVRRQAAAGDRLALRRELGVPEGARLVGMVGQIARWKGQEHFIRAAALLAPRFPDVRFPIIGEVQFDEWEYKTELIGLIRELRPAERIILPGHHHDVLSRIGALDALAHCSVEPEPFGRIVIEAMALGVPVVAASGGAIDEIITDGKTGIMVPPCDARALAMALAMLLEQPRRAASLGAAAREMAGRRFSMAGMVARINDVLEGVADG